MQTKIKKAIQRVINKKYAQGEVFPCADSMEVAKILKMDVKDLETLAKNIEGILIYTTIDRTYYEL